MGDENKIENMKEIEERVKAIIDKAVKVLEEHLKIDDGLRKCPLCRKEFDPIEIGIETRTLPPNISEHLYKGIMEAFKEVQIKPERTNPNNDKILVMSGKAIDALKRIRHILEAFGTTYKKAGDNNALMFSVISDINQVVMKPLG